jgi:type III secretory pathway lipoprotein EscJ
MDARHDSSPSERSRLVTPSQVVALGLVAASIGWAAWLLRDRPANEEVELLTGMTLPSSEMAIMEAAFDRAQLTGHRTEGGRVWVPRGRQSAYMRALVDAEALPREFGGSLRRALEKNSPWQSRAVQDELLRVATQEELALVICSMPGIERAAVLYDAEPQAGLHGGSPTKTASVNVGTQPDMELDAARVQAIRVLVSASIAGLTPERVAVTDLRSGRVYVGPLDDAAEREAAAVAAADPALARQMLHETHLAQKVRQSLSFVKGATVDVSVDFTAVAPAGAEPPTPPLPPEALAGDPAQDAAGELPRTPAQQKVADANTPAEIPVQPLVVAAVPPPPPAAAPAPAPRAANSELPEAIRVLIAVPDAYFQAASRFAELAGQPPVPLADIEAREAERIRRHVTALLPATRDPSRREVIVTGFPMAPNATGRRDTAPRGSAPAAAVSGSTTPAVDRHTATTAAQPQLDLEAIVSLVMAGKFEEVPRPVWMAATSVCVGLLAAVLWLAGGNRRPAADSRRGRSQPRIDWATLGSDEDHDGGAAPSLRRAAAVLLLVSSCGLATGHAVAGEAAPAVAPAPDFDDREPAATALAPEAPEPRGQGFQGSELRPVSPGPVSPQAFAGAATASRKSAPNVLPAVPLDTSGAAAGPAAAARPGQLSDWKLLAVIAAAFVVVAGATVMTRRRSVTLPPDVFEVLGEASLGGPHAVRIVRFGPKTLLVGVSTAGCHTLAELSDPQATACMAAACRGIQQPIRPAAPARPAARPQPAAPAGAEAA